MRNETGIRISRRLASPAAVCKTQKTIPWGSRYRLPPGITSLCMLAGRDEKGWGAAVKTRAGKLFPVLPQHEMRIQRHRCRHRPGIEQSLPLKVLPGLPVLRFHCAALLLLVTGNFRVETDR